MSKPYTPVFYWPSAKTGFFVGNLANGKVVKEIQGVSHELYGSWWPSFFPTVIGFLVTAARGRTNVMTCSCITVMCAYPFMLGLPIFTGERSSRGNGPRYSMELLQKSGQFTVNLGYISEEMTKKAMICGSLSGRNGMDKLAKAGFTTIPSQHVEPPLIRECPLNLECQVNSFVELGTHTWVTGLVHAVHADPELASGKLQYLWRSMPELVKPNDGE